MVSIYLDIEKLYADKDKLHEKYVQNCGSEKGSENMIIIDTNERAVCDDVWDEYVFWLKETVDDYDLDIGVEFKPDDDDVSTICEKALDDLNDKAVIEILGFAGKKINKIKSALESLKGL